MELGKTLYDPSFEHDACGIGAVVNIDGKQTHKIVDNALSIVEKLEHRAGKDATGETGDGVGILVQIAHGFFKKEAAKIGIELGDERDYGVGVETEGPYCLGLGTIATVVGHKEFVIAAPSPGRVGVGKECCAILTEGVDTAVDEGTCHGEGIGPTFGARVG